VSTQAAPSRPTLRTVAAASVGVAPALALEPEDGSQRAGA
jgi:hypothetical protein